jgi:hypothetical protein
MTLLSSHSNRLCPQDIALLLHTGPTSARTLLLEFHPAAVEMAQAPCIRLWMVYKQYIHLLCSC